MLSCVYVYIIQHWLARIYFPWSPPNVPAESIHAKMKQICHDQIYDDDDVFISYIFSTKDEDMAVYCAMSCQLQSHFSFFLFFLPRMHLSDRMKKEPLWFSVLKSQYNLISYTIFCHTLCPTNSGCGQNMHWLHNKLAGAALCCFYDRDCMFWIQLEDIQKSGTSWLHNWTAMGVTALPIIAPWFILSDVILCSGH